LSFSLIFPFTADFALIISRKILSIWLLNDPHPFKILIRQLLSGNKMTFNVIMMGLSKSPHE
jgi:hypothetical protein